MSRCLLVVHVLPCVVMYCDVSYCFVISGIQKQEFARVLGDIMKATPEEAGT